MKHLLISLAIIAMLVSPAYAWTPWESDINALQSQIDDLRTEIEVKDAEFIIPLSYAHGGEEDQSNQIIDWQFAAKVSIELSGPQTIEFTNLIPGDELLIFMQNQTNDWQPIFWPAEIEWENHFTGESPPKNEMKIFRLLCGPHNKIYGVILWNRHPWN